MEGSELAQHGTPAAFRSRVDDVFGQLQPVSDAHGSTWSLSQQQVFRPGKEEAYSSDEEREAVAGDRARQELLPGSLVDFEGDDEEFPVKPSQAFCQALDGEEEYDFTDHQASGRGEDYETSLPPNYKQQDADTHAVRLQGGPEQLALTDRPSQGQQVSHFRAAARASRVPDHVRNPERYTCYVLDEPLVVGSGGGGDKTGQPVSQSELSAHQTSSPADGSIHLTAAGSMPEKVQFRARPRALGDRMQTDAHNAVSAVNSSQATARVDLSGVMAADDDTETRNEEMIMQEADDEKGTTTIPRFSQRYASRAARRLRQPAAVDKDDEN